MRKSGSNSLAWHALLAAMLSLGILHGADARSKSQAATPAPGALDWKQGVVNKYCLGCHNAKLKTAGMVLEGLDVTQAPNDAAVWEKVLHKIRTAEMPPRGLPRPTPEQYTAFASSLEETLDSAAAAHPEPGRPGVHRLNRTEYSNAVRDLLALDIQAGASLPADNTGYGFDNIADVLSTSPVLLERYISVARSVSRQAVGDLKLKPVKDRFEPPHESSPTAKGRNERIGDDLPFDSRGGIVFKRYFPLDAEYVIEIKMAPDPQVAAAEGIDKPAVNELRVPLKAGLHTLGVTFPRDSSMAELETPVVVRRAPAKKGAKVLTSNMDLWVDSARLKTFEVVHLSANPEIANVLVGGPYNVTGRGATPSRAKIFTCRPTSPSAEVPCARKILTNLAHRAFRRPVTEADITPLLAFYRSGRKAGDFDDGIEKALEAMLVSPDFLFRVEQDPGGLKAASVYTVSDIDLASRLSFFLWSSIPDDQLLALAEQHKLKDPKILEQQVRRMLADSRSQALIVNFAGQWLDLRNLATWRPDAGLFPQFDESLRKSMQQQTELFFESVVRENRSMLDLLDADYTYLNQRLAEHYGIAGIYGSQFRRVALSDPNREGLLGQASILTVTSYPSRTSVVQRGKWVLENLLGTPPPPPPPDVPAFPSASKDGKQMTTRQAMEMHRANAVCASCHARMEPIGFALENYDAIGRWRSEDAGKPLDVSGKLPDGAQFAGPEQLSKLLATKYKDDFISTVSEKLLIYALGRGLEYYDKPTVRSITRRAASDNYTMNALVLAIVNSTPFQMRRSLEHHNDTDE
jgi:mono/diheme cytochrome c family protein